MKIIKIEFLVQKGPFPESLEFENILGEIRKAVSSVTYPEGSGQFTLNPAKKGNGVVPIKKNFLQHLVRNDWRLEHRMSIASRVKPGPIDAVKKTSDGRCFSVEWETGNISSSHRLPLKWPWSFGLAVLVGSMLILPSEMYRYLADRIVVLLK